MDMIALPKLGMKVSPRMVAANHILELSSLELQQAITAELDDNPALEKIEEPSCAVCGGPLRGSICPQCLAEQKRDLPVDDFNYEVPEEFPVIGDRRAAADEEFDPMTQVADQLTLAEHLSLELQAVVSRVDLPLAEYLIGNLDERGYLVPQAVEDCAEFFGVSVDHVERILRQLQQLDPVGIGARSLEECLLIQVDFLKRERGVEQPYAREVVERFLTELGEHKFGRIAVALKTTQEAIVEVWEFIKTQLNPYPAHQFAAGAAATAASNYVMPDVIINPRDGGYEVDVAESRRFFLRVSPMYRQLATSLSETEAQFSEADKQHIQHYVSRAKLFIQNITQRRQTLHRITSCLIEHQRDYLDHGIRHLRPMTRAAIADELGIHESTVSRATAAKFVMLPNREVVPFSTFFTPSLSVKDVIKEIIDNEETPLTDQEIAQLLAERGIQIARRTVAKYREQLGILPSPLR